MTVLLNYTLPLKRLCVQPSTARLQSRHCSIACAAAAGLLLSAGRPAANPRTLLLRSIAGTDRRTDSVPLQSDPAARANVQSRQFITVKRRSQPIRTCSSRSNTTRPQTTRWHMERKCVENYNKWHGNFFS